MSKSPAGAAPCRALLFFAAVLGTPAAARAGGVQIRLDHAQIASGTGASLLAQVFGRDPSDPATVAAGGRLDQQMNALVPTLTDQFSARIDQSFARLDTHGVLRAMADAAGGAGKLLPADTVSDAAVASLGAGVGVSANGFQLSDLRHFSIDAGDGELPERGIGAAAGATLTFHLRTLPLPRWRTFDPSRLSLAVSYMRFGPYRFGDDVELGFSNWGLRAGYQVLDGHAFVRRGLVRWGGLFVGLGVAHNALHLGVSGKLPAGDEELPVDDGEVPLGMRLSYGGEARFRLDSSAWVVPVEVTSHFQLGYLLTLFGGLGFDFNRTATSGAADVDSSNVVLKAGDTDDASSFRTIANPTAELDAQDRAAGAWWDARAFVGLQVNLLYAAVFAQAGLDTTHNVSANVGLRVFY